MNAFRYVNDARFNFYKDDFATHTLYQCITKNRLNVSIFRWYNSVLQDLIVNYRISVKNKVSSSWTETSEILKSYSHFKIRSHSCCLFLFHIDYTIYANHVLIKTTMSNKRYRTHYKIQSDLDTFGSDSISLRTFTREVKVVQSQINK